MGAVASKVRPEAENKPIASEDRSSLTTLLRAADEADRGLVVDVSGLSREQYLSYLMKKF